MNSRIYRNMKKKHLSTRPDDRGAVLEQRRREKMARSAHAYVRGNTLQFYEWLEAGSGDNLPQGPSVWICGDCHAGNLGPVANAEGEVEIQIRDLDQTVIGNPAHDLIRLGLSLATAALDAAMPEDHARRVVTGACNLSPHLGERMLPIRFLRRSVFLSELMPRISSWRWSN